MKQIFSKNIARFLAGFGFFLLYAPLLTVVVLSFLNLKVDTPHFTFEWYQHLTDNKALQDSLLQSMSVAFASATIATILGTMGAYGLERANFPGKHFLDSITIAPLILPEMVLGLSLLIWFAFTEITLGWMSMMLAHVTFGVSYVVMVVRARLQNFDHILEDAARDLGASKLQVFFKINLPINLPGVVSGFLMTFILSFDDFIIAFFTTGVGSDTLPLKLYSLIKLGFDPQIYALSAIILAFTLFCVLMLSRLGRGLHFIQRH